MNPFETMRNTMGRFGRVFFRNIDGPGGLREEYYISESVLIGPHHLGGLGNNPTCFSQWGKVERFNINRRGWEATCTAPRCRFSKVVSGVRRRRR